MYFGQAESNGFVILSYLLHMDCVSLYQSHDLHFLRAYDFDSFSSTGTSGPNKLAMRLNICLFSFILIYDCV